MKKCYIKLGRGHHLIPSVWKTDVVAGCGVAVDASEAGDGNLEIQVTADGESVPNYVRQESDTNFRVSFTPQRPSKHHISVRFNGEPVPGRKQ